MNIISYRGPGKAGGVSSTLARLWREHARPGAVWWYLNDSSFQSTQALDDEPIDLSPIPQNLIEGHYRYCNEFLWPVLHDLPQYALYKAEDHKSYVSLNRILSRMVSRDRRRHNLEPVFVQDYQLALMPELLIRLGSMRSVVFWHIPWPRMIDPAHVPHLTQIARALMSASLVGFHTEEYAKNFLDFVEAHVSGSYVNHRQQFVARKPNVVPKTTLPWIEETPTLLTSAEETISPTQVIVAPLGIDVDFWERASALPQLRLHQQEFAPLTNGKPFILSVDRADYTKGVIERIQAIDCFFECNPDWRGNVVFAQICGRTRPGLEAFDRYWNQCKIEAAKLECRWRSNGWSPLLWLEKPCTPEELAVLYRSASVMLVNPIRDGLNLTAKEYAAAQVDKKGILTLSNGAGAWHELGQHTIDIDPLDLEGSSNAILTALHMDQAERARRLTAMQQSLRANTLASWWQRVDDAVRTHIPAANQMDSRTLRIVKASESA